MHNDVDVKGIEQTAPKRERSEVGSSRHNSYVIHNSPPNAIRSPTHDPCLFLEFLIHHIAVREYYLQGAGRRRQFARAGTDGHAIIITWRNTSSRWNSDAVNDDSTDYRFRGEEKGY